MNFFFSCLVNDLCFLVAIAFYTLLERKVLGYIQLRKGPNKVGLSGVPQPLADAVKLFVKEQNKPSLMNKWPFFFAPVLSLILSISLWFLYPSCSFVFFFSFGVLFFVSVSSLSVYGTLVAGWSSNSKYALLGALRAVAQTISYEVRMVLILLGRIFFVFNFNLFYLFAFQEFFWISFLRFPVAFVWVVTTLAETNRSPFDFAEGESELVSGFNVEYGGGGFALIFMAEYGRILVMSILTGIIFFGGTNFFFFNFDFFLILKGFFFSFFFLWARGSLPRMRYDCLMMLTWKRFLPFSLCFLSFVVGVFFFL